MKICERICALGCICTKEKLKTCLQHLKSFLLNPRLLFCLLLAWLITNGWSYILFGIGMLLKIDWMRVVGGAYMSFLWLPFTPEKLLTMLIAIGLLRLFFPNDQRTLGVLRHKLALLRRKKLER